MAKITNLTNTYWNIPAGWTATAGYGRFNVEISIDENGEGIGGYERLEVGYTIDADNPGDSLTKANCVTFGPYSFWEYDNSKTFQIRFNGGADVTNTSLITWLEANGEMEGGETESDVVTVKYMDKTIEIATGSSAVLHVAKRLMEEDVTITVPEMGGVDVAADTVTEADVLSGVTFHKADGTQAEGMIETYDVTDNRNGDTYAILKAKINKPNGITEDAVSIIEMPVDAEIAFDHTSIDYMKIPVTDDISVRVLTMSARLGLSRNNNRVSVFYVWEEDLAGLRLAAPTLGLDPDMIVEGWYELTDSGAILLTEERRYELVFGGIFDFMEPATGFERYLYSLFEFFTGEFDIADTVERNPNATFDTISVKEQYCKKNVMLVGSIYRRLWGYTPDGMLDQTLNEFNDLQIRERPTRIYVDIDFVKNAECELWLTRYLYPFGSTAAISMTQSPSLSAGKNTYDFSSCLFGLGISMRNHSPTTKISTVYTNAVIHTQTDTEVYITGLRNGTHIAIVVEDSANELSEWDGSYTLSDNTISFTIDGVSYKAKNGMTWGEWVMSEYNTLNAYLQDGQIFIESGVFIVGTKTVLYDDEIIAGGSYVSYAGGN